MSPNRFQTWLLICAAFSASGFLVSTAFAGECDQPVAVAVSVQGEVIARKGGASEWGPIERRDEFCPGDAIQVLRQSRADLLLVNETTLRLDQNTEVVFGEPKKEKGFFLDVLLGGTYFMSRTPRTFRIHTPFVNAGVGGTEFFIGVEKDRALLTVYEGRITAANDLGSVTLDSGQSAAAEAGRAPVSTVLARPRDAVRWTLFYPAVISTIPGVPSSWRDRAISLLSVGRVDEAGAVIEEALKTAPGDADALALQAVIAVALNDRDAALDLARKAVASAPKSASALVALSYAQQTSFDLEGALSTLEKAVMIEPENALARARLSELLLSFGRLDEALGEAKKAAGTDQDVARTQTVLGFAYLAQIKTKDSRIAFERAIGLDQADPLPHLGMGLAMIRDGDVEGGRKEIEIAASLDPNDSILRSYLGKAYYEEKRDGRAATQFGMAKEFDPNDPTPFFYDAIRKQSVNRPVEALKDMQQAISRNDNRAIYRSRLLLDEDLAARSASLGRIYSDLGFQQLALVEGWKSVNTDPSNYSAHRFLADSYSALPRHEIARVSELLQSQLLQPININPVQPSLSQSKLFILEGAGPSGGSFNEFNPLFNRNRLALQASGVVGENSTRGEEIVHSAVAGNFSYSVGQYHFETQGFRPNNDLRQSIYDAFAQLRTSHDTSLQMEFLGRDEKKGDLGINIFPDEFDQNLRLESEIRSLRFGFHHALSPGTDFIGNFVYQTFKTHDDAGVPPVLSIDRDTDEDNYGGEIQLLHRSLRYSVVGGGGVFTTDLKEVETTVFSPPPPPPPIPPPPPMTDTTDMDDNIDHSNVYVYSLVHFPRHVTWTLGASAEFFRGGIDDRDQVNPKVGVTWTPLPSTTLRAAAFRTLKRALINNQTLEPTQVAGFNQFFDDPEGTRTWRYGAAIDHKFSGNLYGGAEYSRRDLEMPFPATILSPPAPAVTVTNYVDWEEQLGRAYLFWAPHPWVSLSAEYEYERFDRDSRFSVGINRVETNRIPLGVGFFHPCGFFSRLKGTYFNQEGDFETQFSTPPNMIIPGSDEFWVVDASVGYRLPKRYGIITIEAKNLFDESFRYQDTDQSSPVLQPERSVFFKFTLAL